MCCNYSHLCQKYKTFRLSPPVTACAVPAPSQRGPFAPTYLFRQTVAAVDLYAAAELFWSVILQTGRRCGANYPFRRNNPWRLQ